MRDNKGRNKNHEDRNKLQNEELFEMSETGYGLESVEKGTDFAEGDRDTYSNGGGHQKRGRQRELKGTLLFKKNLL